MTDPIIEEIKQLNRETAALMKEGAQDMKELRKMMKEFSKSFGGYTKNEADGIEDETNRMLFKFLLATFPEYNIFKINAWKTLQSPLIRDMKAARNESSITEFDGLYIVSKNKDYYVDSLVSGDFKTNFTGMDVNANNFVILEAKHALSNALVDNKIKQIVEFQKYMQISYDPKVHTIEFKKKLDVYELIKFAGKTIYLFFASPYITVETQQYITSNASVWLKNFNIRVGFMVPEGNRYGSIKWFGPNEDMSVESLISIQRVIIGRGCKKKAKRINRKCK